VKEFAGEMAVVIGGASGGPADSRLCAAAGTGSPIRFGCSWTSALIAVLEACRSYGP
jgi:hypothetical protein